LQPLFKPLKILYVTLKLNNLNSRHCYYDIKSKLINMYHLQLLLHNHHTQLVHKNAHNGKDNYELRHKCFKVATETVYNTKTNSYAWKIKFISNISITIRTKTAVHILLLIKGYGLKSCNILVMAAQKIGCWSFPNAFIQFRKHKK